MNKHKESIDIKDIVKKYGADLSRVDLSGYIIDMSFKDIANIVLPKDNEFFQKIKSKSLHVTRMPKGDYSKYNFDGVNIKGSIFTEDSILPEDRDFFQKLEGKSLSYTTMPEGNYSKCDFGNVCLFGASFTENSIFSRDKVVFQKICDKSISRAILPNGDYREYSFEGVNCSMTKFAFNSLLPENSNFLQTINSSFDGEYEEDYIMGEDGFRLTKNVLKNIHRYDLKGLNIYLSDYEEYLSESQLSLIRIKYKEEINENIFLPEKGLLKEKDSIKEENINRELII